MEPLRKTLPDFRKYKRPNNPIVRALAGGMALLLSALGFMGPTCADQAPAKAPLPAFAPYAMPDSCNDCPVDAESWAALRQQADTLPERYAHALECKLSGLQKPFVRGSWQIAHRERGQTFAHYARRKAGRLPPEQHTLYMITIGEMSAEQAAVVDSVRGYLAAFYGLPVKTLPALPDSLVPPSARREHPEPGDLQYKSTYLLGALLRPRVPDDAVALLGFTATDLYPSEKWNYVFGQASIRGRIGVWSVARFDDPARSPRAFRNCFLRAAKTASHETGHMLGLLHCIAYECNLSGSNNRTELDRRAPWLCPQCVGKVCWALGQDEAERFSRLARYWQGREPDTVAHYYKVARQMIELHPNNDH